MGENQPAWRSEVCGDCGETYEHCICGGAHRAEVRYLRSLLAHLEWAGRQGYEGGADPACPVCEAVPLVGDVHDPDCWLAKELGR